MCYTDRDLLHSPYEHTSVYLLVDMKVTSRDGDNAIRTNRDTPGQNYGTEPLGTPSIKSKTKNPSYPSIQISSTCWTAWDPGPLQIPPPARPQMTV
jgi:hypothetical protein